jgi:very-short-patch-repair endonuclease
VHALRHGGRLACISAAKARGLWVLDDGRLHLAMTPGHHEHEHHGCRPVLHWNADERNHPNPLMVSVLLALVQIAGCADAEALIAALDSALHTGALPERHLAALRAAVPRALREVVDTATPLAASGLESLTRWRLLRLGIVAVPQHRITGVGEVDLLIGDRLVIELDGGTHDSPKQRRRDVRRDAAAVALGYLVLRFDYDQVVRCWQDVESAVLAVIDKGLHVDGGGRTGSRSAGSTRRYCAAAHGAAGAIRADRPGGRRAEVSR